MRITSNGLPDVSGPTPVSETTRVDAPADAGSSAAPAAGSSSSNAPLQSAALAPALKALAEMPDIDQAKVDAVRDALAKGEIKFDAGKLAGLIARYHGGQ